MHNPNTNFNFGFNQPNTSTTNNQQQPSNTQNLNNFLQTQFYQKSPDLRDLQYRRTCFRDWDTKSAYINHIAAMPSVKNFTPKEIETMNICKLFLKGPEKENPVEYSRPWNTNAPYGSVYQQGSGANMYQQGSGATGPSGIFSGSTGQQNQTGSSVFGGSQPSAFGGFGQGPTSSLFSNAGSGNSTGLFGQGTTQTFGSSKPTTSLFGSSKPASSIFGSTPTQPSSLFANTPSQPSFANTSNQPSFGNPPSRQTSSIFGNPSSNQPSSIFGSNTPSSFGQPSFGNTATAQPIFSNTQSGQPSSLFGNPPNQQSFGNPPSTTTPGLGNTSSQNSFATPPSFGNTTSSIFKTDNTPPPVFGNTTESFNPQQPLNFNPQQGISNSQQPLNFNPQQGISNSQQPLNTNPQSTNPQSTNPQGITNFNIENKQNISTPVWPQQPTTEPPKESINKHLNDLKKYEDLIIKKPRVDEYYFNDPKFYDFCHKTEIGKKLMEPGFLMFPLKPPQKKIKFELEIWPETKALIESEEFTRPQKKLKYENNRIIKGDVTFTETFLSDDQKKLLNSLTPLNSSTSRGSQELREPQELKDFENPEKPNISSEKESLSLTEKGIRNDTEPEIQLFPNPALFKGESLIYNAKVIFRNSLVIKFYDPINSKDFNLENVREKIKLEFLDPSLIKKLTSIKHIKIPVFKDPKNKGLNKSCFCKIFDVNPKNILNAEKLVNQKDLSGFIRVKANLKKILGKNFVKYEWSEIGGCLEMTFD